MALKPVDWLKVTRLALQSRQLDAFEVKELAPRGKIKYQFSAGGHELSQILLSQALDHPHDGVGVYYRSRPLMLGLGQTLIESLAAGMARQASPSQGRDGGVVYNRPGSGGPTVLPSSGDVGSQYTPAAGWGQAILYRQQVLQEKEWQGALAAVMGGDGSVASNGFWAALNMATTLNLPLLFFIEDNGYGISVPSVYQTPDGNIAANLASFGNLHILDASGVHPEAAWQAICEAADHVRGEQGPSLLRMRVVRLAGHTFIDDQAYKSVETRAEEAARDPLQNLRTYMLENQGLSAQEWDELAEQARQEVYTAWEAAERLPEPDPAKATENVFYEGIPPQQGGLRPEKALIPPGQSLPQPRGARINLIEAVRRTLETEMQLNPRILVFGEDVGVKGGVHGATLDMQRHFGAGRVFDTSLSEEGIIGRSVGMALAGLLPVPEIQFRKYADPAHEQINDLGTLRWRTANRFAAPVVVRIPVGFSKKTGDPWHSVSGEAIYAHMIGWRIAMPSNAEDAAGLLRTALRGDDPTFFFEHRALLDTVEGRRPYPGDNYCLPFGVAAQLLEGHELTLITWGAMVHRCLEAAQAFPGRVTLLDLRTVLPWDQEAVLESVQKTGKVLVVHEDNLTGGFAGEIIATIASQAFTALDAPIERMATADTPIPYHTGLMNAILPDVTGIQQKIADLLAY